jgi:hypothetical protein
MERICRWSVCGHLQHGAGLASTRGEHSGDHGCLSRWARCLPPRRLLSGRRIAACSIRPIHGQLSPSASNKRLKLPARVDYEWTVAARALQFGVCVILEFGFWSRSEREQFRARAAALGASSEVHALVLPEDELWARLSQRNAKLPPGTFAITREQLATWWKAFEPPAREELSRRPAEAAHRVLE